MHKDVNYDQEKSISPPSKNQLCLINPTIGNSVNVDYNDVKWSTFWNNAEQVPTFIMAIAQINSIKIPGICDAEVQFKSDEDDTWFQIGAGCSNSSHLSNRWKSLESGTLVKVLVSNFRIGFMRNYCQILDFL